ncbi:MAG: hypothetical protein AB4290_05030 [Spirulina sp.]
MVDIVKNLPDRVKQSPLNLHALQKDFAKALTVLSDYGKNLSYLQEYQYSIEVNTNNYKKRLERLKELDRDCDIDFLNEFENYTFEKYLPQVTTDYKSLSAGLQLLENTSKTIEGIIQLEQAKRDRNLNETIFIVSAGIGTASASASSVASFAERIMINLYPPSQKDSLSTGYLFAIYSCALILSIAVGLGFSGIMWLWMKLFSQKKRA